MKDKLKQLFDKLGDQLELSYKALVKAPAVHVPMLCVIFVLGVLVGSIWL